MYIYPTLKNALFVGPPNSTASEDGGYDFQLLSFGLRFWVGVLGWVLGWGLGLGFWVGLGPVIH